MRWHSSLQMPTIFDANIRLGRLASSRAPYFSTAQELLAAMDAHGIGRALVYSALARESDYRKGNELLQQKIEGLHRLQPCWVAVPHRESPEDLVLQMNRHQVSALRLFPHTGHFSIRPWCIGALCQALSDTGKLLLLDFESPSWSSDRTDWEGIYQLCNAFPELHILVCGVTMAGPANYRGFLHRCEHLYLETSQFVCPGEVKRLASEGLAHRLIFGSDCPSRHWGAPLAMLSMETLGEKTLSAILHDNLAARIPHLQPDKPIPNFGQPDNPPPIIDTHVHLGGWNFSHAASGLAQDTVREMDRCGICSVIATSLWSCFGEVVLGNADIANACEAFPGRIYGYLTLDPKHPEEVEDETSKYANNSSFRGIKLHGQTHAVEIDDPRCSPILSYADEKGMPVLVHQTRLAPEPWLEICSRYPSASFIVAHVGGCGPDDGRAVALARLAAKVKNLYVDIAATRNHYGFLEELIEWAGDERILFGSDHPIMDFGFELGQVLFSTIDRTSKERILSANARRLFRL